MSKADAVVTKPEETVDVFYKLTITYLETFNLNYGSALRQAVTINKTGARDKFKLLIPNSLHNSFLRQSKIIEKA